MRLGRDGVAGLIGLATSVILLPMSLGLPKLPIVPIGPGFYPAIVLVFVAVMSAVLLFQDFAAHRQAPAAAAEGAVPAPPRRNYPLVLASFVAVAIYIALLPLLGFRIATVLFVAAFQLVLERPTTWLRFAIQVAVAVATSAVTYLVFERYLSVLLPRGIWTGW